VNPVGSLLMRNKVRSFTRFIPDSSYFDRNAAWLEFSPLLHPLKHTHISNSWWWLSIRLCPSTSISKTFQIFIHTMPAYRENYNLRMRFSYLIFFIVEGEGHFCLFWIIF
jgi:hypothetical protein